MIAVEVSMNKKTGPVSATYAPIKQSCPDCPLKDKGCYAQLGNAAYHVRRIEAKAEGLDPASIARAEALAIDNLTGQLPLRVHVSGDCRTVAAAASVGAAMARRRAKHGRAAWTYTHAWRIVPRAAWGNAPSVLASCESLDQIDAAAAQGYRAFAVIVTKHESDKAYEHNGRNVIPCPEQTTKGVTCTTCGLCMKERGQVIAFAAHGSRKSAVIEQL